MAPSRVFKHLALHMPRAAFGDSELEILAFEALLQGKEIQIENVDSTLDNKALELRQRLITSTDAINNHESTEQIAGGIGTQKEGVRGNTTKDVIEKVTIEVIHKDVAQKGTSDEEAAKKADFEDIISDGISKHNNIEEGVIAKNAAGILVDHSGNSDPNHDFENSGAYKDIVLDVVLKVDGGATREVVKVESENDDDDWVLA
ncbi:hypothetical protein EAE96_004264 [Botrytis aclada]|nr:hypothetical protein EAE96_004264 [Botrytis aclada]